MDDEALLVARAQQGDRAAMDALLRHHYDRVHAVCRRITGTETEADDATQEALIAITRGLARFDGGSRLSTWIYRVTVNACLDELRRRRRRPRPTDLLDRQAVPSGEAAVDARLDVSAALARLPVEFRVAVVLRDLGGLDYAEIADVLGVPIGTVRSRIARGRAGVADALTEAGNPGPASDRPSSAGPAPTAGLPSGETQP